MIRTLAAVLAATTLTTVAVAQSPSNQAPDWKQTLGGLLNGNQDRDDALRQAYERGYQRGRTDEARLQQNRQPRSDNDSYNSRDRDSNSRDRGGYNSR